MVLGAVTILFATVFALLTLLWDFLATLETYFFFALVFEVFAGAFFADFAGCTATATQVATVNMTQDVTKNWKKPFTS
jgi:hypothetical protein